MSSGAVSTVIHLLEKRYQQLEIDIGDPFHQLVVPGSAEPLDPGQGLSGFKGLLAPPLDVEKMAQLFEARQGKYRQRIVGPDFLHGVEEVVCIQGGNHRLRIRPFNNQLQPPLCGKAHKFPGKLFRL